nr:unnamed protein product [Spirometra erinaceieuropaei]
MRFQSRVSTSTVHELLFVDDCVLKTTSEMDMQRSMDLFCCGLRELRPDNPRSNRPERMTTLVAQELARYKVEIAELSLTRFSEQGQVEEVGAGYTFWNDRLRASPFTIGNDIVGRLPPLPQSIDGRLMSLRLPLR